MFETREIKIGEQLFRDEKGNVHERDFSTSHVKEKTVGVWSKRSNNEWLKSDPPDFTLLFNISGWKCNHDNACRSQKLTAGRLNNSRETVF